MTEPRVGQPFGRYRIEGILGRGGMGVVYRAADTRLERTVALKTLGPERSGDPAFRDRFLRESRLLAGLDHPHIVPIYEADEVDGELYLALRYVDGQELGTLLERSGPLEPARAVELIAQIADALDAAHAAGLVHRDVKPANILVERGRRGVLDHAYLTDFGLTKQVAALSGPTMVGQFVGTPGYVAPEQIEGKQVDHRADIYALGCVMYNCLTGAVPYPRDSTVAALWAHLWEPPPRPSDLRHELPAGFDTVIATALAKPPAERYQTAGALAAAARAALATATAVMRTEELAPPAPSPALAPAPAMLVEGASGDMLGDAPVSTGSPPEYTVVDQVRPATEPPGPGLAATPVGRPADRASLPWAGRLGRFPRTVARRPVLLGAGATASVVALLVIALVGGAIRLTPVDEVGSPGPSGGAGSTPGGGAVASPAAIIGPSPSPRLAGWKVTGSLREARSGHTATLLADGKVLVAGGIAEDGPSLSAELYERQTGDWALTAEMSEARSGHTATLLDDGRVLVAGGVNGQPLKSAELYDPRDGTWLAIDQMHGRLANHAAVLLSDGRVFVSGAATIYNDRATTWSPWAEVYDPRSGTWTVTGVMHEARVGHTATLLMDGTVLVAGGSNVDDFRTLATSEVYDPSTGTWTLIGSMAEARFEHTATLLRNGSVLVTGGSKYDGNTSLASAGVEVYDPRTNTWTVAEMMREARESHTATLLDDGRVLVAGGRPVFGETSFLASAEMYEGESGRWTAIPSMVNPRGSHTSTLLADGTVLVAGGSSSSSEVFVSESSR